MAVESALIVFARKPRPGAVKTRLAKSIGYDAACEVYTRMLALVLEQASGVDATRYIFLPPGDVLPDSLKPRSSFVHCVQDGKDLGKRMASAFEEVFSLGHSKAILIGSDCPYITTGILQRSFESLKSADTVFGPALDGGYYLLGQNTPSRDLFSNIEWSTDQVWSSTLDRLAKGGWTYHEVDMLEDIDDNEAYSRWLDHLRLKQQTD